MLVIGLEITLKDGRVFRQVVPEGEEGDEMSEEEVDALLKYVTSTTSITIGNPHYINIAMSEIASVQVILKEEA